ncbi:hypothetical protein F0U60_12945 [Archangium minus]|uniref:Uncharacterized protein n=1 Tax=Archangium minus TaxID=83450 RepID=A0ABY9WMR0_9BACT|nr:hypothetical protein F0U60_12945 [Archangium minus]
MQSVMRVLGLLLLLLAAPSLAEERAKTVLLFVPEDDTVPATAGFSRNFRQTVQREWRAPVTVNIEYLDMAWFSSPEYERALRDFYVAKYRSRRPDALVVFADATPFLLKLQQELWPEVPLLCILNDDFLAEAVPKSPYLRGNWADLDIPATVKLALQLLPDTRHVVLVLGSSQRELDAWSWVEQEVRSAAPGREFIGLSGLTLEELRQRVRTLLPVGGLLEAAKIRLEAEIVREREAPEALQAFSHALAWLERTGSSPSVVALWKARAHRLRAHHDFVLGRDARSLLTAAVEEIHAVARDSPENLRLLKELVLVHLLQAENERREGRDPKPALQEARAAMWKVTEVDAMRAELTCEAANQQSPFQARECQRLLREAKGSSR